MRYVFMGKPMPQPRPRMVRRGSFVTTYDPLASHKQAMLWELKAQHPKIVKPPIQVVFRAYMPIPKSWSKKKQEAMVGEFHTSKPDLDNLQKTIFDVMEGTVFENDSEIATIDAMKIYGKEPRVDVEISTVDF